MDEQQHEPGWFAIAWNTLRIWTRRRLFASRTRRVLTALAAAAALAGGLFGYANLQRVTDSDPGRGVAEAAEVPAPANAAARAANGARAVSRPVDRAALVAEGKRLAADHRLMLARVARAQLTRGRVDHPVTAALWLLLERHMIQVVTFGPPDPDGMLRSITIDCVDDIAVRAGSRKTSAVLEFFSELRPPLAPQSVRLTMRGKSTVIAASYQPADR